MTLSQGHNTPSSKTMILRDILIKRGSNSTYKLPPLDVKHKAVYFQSTTLVSVLYIGQGEDLFQQLRVAYLACIGWKNLSLVIISCCYHTAVLALSRIEQNFSFTLCFINLKNKYSFFLFFPTFNVKKQKQNEGRSNKTSHIDFIYIKNCQKLIRMGKQNYHRYLFLWS